MITLLRTLYRARGNKDANRLPRVEGHAVGIEDDELERRKRCRGEAATRAEGSEVEGVTG